MFCEKCGAQLPSDAMFCTNCGASVHENTKVQEKIVDNEVQLNVKPTFKIGYMLVSEFAVLLAATLILLSTTMMLVLVAGSTDFSILAVGCLVFVILCLAWMAFRKKQYDNYSYDFYKTKVIYKDGFLNKSEKEVKYKHIREISKRESFIQRFFGLGTIILHTNAESGYGNGIYILNVENVDSIYKKINEMIDC